MTYGLNYTPTSVGPTTTPTQVLARNTQRRALVLFNVGTVDAQFAIDNVGYINIPAGGHIALVGENAPANAIWVRTLSGTGSFVIWER